MTLQAVVVERCSSIFKNRETLSSGAFLPPGKTGSAMIVEAILVARNGHGAMGLRTTFGEMLSDLSHTSRSCKRRHRMETDPFRIVTNQNEEAVVERDGGVLGD